MIHHRSFSFLTFIALLLLLVFPSCGPDQPAEGESQAVTFKNNDNIVRARLSAEPDRLNIMLSTNVYARAINEQIFLYLLHFDPQTLELTPQLAKSRPEIREITEGEYAGGMAYTFELLDEARWDDGSPITAKDMEFTLKVLFNPKVNAAHLRAYLDYIAGLETYPDNPRKFTVLTSRKYILGEAAVSNLPILPPQVYDPEGLMAPFTVEELAAPESAARLAKEAPALQQFADAFNSPKFSREKGFIAGPGPYEFVKWETGQEIVLQRKENWWGGQLAEQYPLLQAHPEKLIFRIISDPAATVTALKDQQVDVASQINAKDFVGLRENELATGLYEFHTPASMVYYYVGLNNKDPKLRDKRVRRALAHLVNVPELIDNLFYGLAERTVGPFHPTKPYYHKGLEPIPFSPEKARALLAEAGWEDSNGNGIVDKEIEGERVEMEIEYKISTTDFAENSALLFKDNARKAGINVHIVALEFTVLINDSKQRNYEMYSAAWGQDPTLDDPKQLWHTESDTPDGSNRVSFSSAEADRIIEEIRVTLDEKKRQQLYKEFQEIIYEEQPYIFLFVPLERIAISKRFEAKTSARRPGFFVNNFIKRDVVPK